MKKRIALISLMCFFACSTEKDTESIPITSSSNLAIAEFKKGIEFTNVLKIDEAEIAFRKAIELDSTFVMAHLELALLRDNYNTRKEFIAKAMDNLGHVSEGERLMVLGKNKFYGNQEGDSEFSYFKRLVKLYPQDDKANYLFAYINVHHGQHQPDSAIHYYKKAIKINPNVSEYYERLTEAYLLNQDFENAEKNINRHIAFLPDHESPHISYGEMLLTSHRYLESIDAYQKVLQINPKAPWAIIGIATNLNFLNRFTEARNYLDKLDSIPLSDYEYRHKWRARTCSYLVEGKIDSAIVVLNQQLNETQTGINKRETLFHQYYPLLRITRLYFENNQPDEGLKSYNQLREFVVNNIERASRVESTKALETYYRAYAHVLNDDLESAENLLNKEEFTEDEKVLLARILMKRQKLDQAINLLEGLDSENAYYQFWLAEAYKNNSQKSAYQKHLKKIKSLIEIDDLDYALTVNYLRK